ncbi:MAG: NAD(P)H-dependent oxidoreductase [Deltaproteobacteria bacterium]|nr:NAD(P)H-dependent oxidoreductase [Deltaproteobacteria bacterium]
MSNKTNNANKIDLSRRNLLKTTFAGLVAGVATPVLPHLFPAPAAATVTAKTKVLIVYYSRSGNSREIANQIHERVGGNIIELQTVKPYPEEYDAVTKQAKQELNSGFKPALKTKVEKIGAYDVIFVGTPIWWGTMATPFKSFLAEYDLSGKTIVPFITHQGSGLGRSVTDIAVLCPNSTILAGLGVWGKDAKTAQNEVSAWVRRLGMKE